MRRPGLPVGYGSIEYLVGEVFYHFGDEAFLYRRELLCGVVLRSGGELTFPLYVLLRVLEANVDRHFELHLGTVAFSTDTLVVLVVTRNLASDMEVTVALDDLQTCLIGIFVLQLGVEHGLHRCPAIGCAVGYLVYLYGVYQVVVDARAGEGIFGQIAACEQGQCAHAPHYQIAVCPQAFHSIPYSLILR